MPNKSLSRSGLLTYQKYSSLLAGNDPYIPFTSDYQLLETTTLGSAQATVSFSNLSVYSSDYQHLQLRITAKTSSGTGSSGGNLLTFNNDAGTNYAFHRFRIASDESAPSGQISTGQSGIDWGYIPRDDSGSSFYAGYIIDVLDAFDTGKYSVIKCSWGFYQATVQYVGLNSGIWANTNSLTDIDFNVASYSYAAGSRFSLYGRKVN